MIITDETKMMLRSAINQAGDTIRLAKQIGAANAGYIDSWLNGNTKSMPVDVFCKLQQYILRYEPKSSAPQPAPAVKVYWNEDIAYFARQIIGAKIGTGCACWISEHAYAQRTPEQEKIPITLSRAMLYVLMIIQDYELEAEGR